MKLSVKESKLLVCELGTVTIQLVYILKFAFQPEKFAGLSRNRPRPGHNNRKIYLMVDEP